MQRRVALKQMALAAGGLLTAPHWANAWTAASLPGGPSILSPDQMTLLTDMADTLIPASDTPGAKALNVPAFVEKMVADCYEPAIQQQFTDGLLAVNALSRERFGQPFSACNPAQRTDVLNALEASTETPRQEFYTLFKTLTIQGYTTSEYVMTKFLNYTPIPGHYYGCVPAPVATR